MQGLGPAAPVRCIVSLNGPLLKLEEEFGRRIICRSNLRNKLNSHHLINTYVFDKALNLKKIENALIFLRDICHTLTTLVHMTLHGKT
ncbi:hypothetical protein BpHYR1_044736 [Brachionus plicatilis]|uniref:Uncharacterized protein n=1 Tax=Brachionus plicatilis TaxID=10195 RepID=A0A3M7Q7M4_BRAPC|nr:hypothetical protein BpHYR1_044736 [Brachionus plicatilis]